MGIIFEPNFFPPLYFEGLLKRYLAFRFCEICCREAEYLCLSGDITENDLKQRREIRNGTLIYEDSPVVSAALKGRVLILEGIEKCERNILPVLNNLLENREMNLEDGRFLISSERYDQLVSEEGREKLEKLKLVRVSKRFRVIVLGVPNGKLDPPFRSRFCCLNVPYPSPLTQIYSLLNFYPNLDINLVRKLVSLAEAIRMMSTGAFVKDSIVSSLPSLPDKALFYIAKHICLFESCNEKEKPEISVYTLLKRVYPFNFLVSENEQDIIENSLENLDLLKKNEEKQKTYLISAQFKSGKVFVELSVNDRVFHLENEFQFNGIPFRAIHFQQIIQHYMQRNPNFVLLEHQIQFLSEILIDHFLGYDVCVVSEKGEGKTLLIRMFANVLGFNGKRFQIVHLYKDMSSRDLFQRRVTNEKGDTNWELNSLVKGAIEGGLVVLDGLDKMKAESLTVLKRLLEDRECELFDGTKLMKWDKYDFILKKKGSNWMEENKILRVSESFRVITTCCPPKRPNKKEWLSSEIISLFSFHKLEAIEDEQKVDLALKLFPKIDKEKLSKLTAFQQKLKSFGKQQSSVSSQSPPFPPLSTRQFLRICKRIEIYPSDLYESLQRNYLTSFLPMNSRESFERFLGESGIVKEENGEMKFEFIVDENKKELIIGDVKAKINEPMNRALVPNVLFYEIPKHTFFLRELLKDIILGENALLLGNQGVGKNKLVDKLLQLLQKERNYIQLHRDTTVESLCLSPCLREGVIIWEDSPLVDAVKTGKCLIIDEIDKAETEVVSVLRGLIEDKEMTLSNGEKIVHPSLMSENEFDESITPIHPDFFVICLGNRPGFPFLGNAFVNEIGDIFSIHVIDNPDINSEIELLRSYAPNVSEDILRKLCLLFNDLRELVQNGVLSYPFSSRELVKIVQHLEKFRDDSVSNALENVLSFDSYDKQLMEHLTAVLYKHGIPFRKSIEFSINLAKEFPLPEPFTSQMWRLFDSAQLVREIIGEKMEMEIKKTWKWQNVRRSELKGRTGERINKFSELKLSWNVVTKGNVCGMVLLEDFVVLTRDPLELHIYKQKTDQFVVVDISSHLPQFSSLKSDPFLFSLPKSGRVLIFIPSYDLILLADMRAQTFSPIIFPPSITKRIQIYSEKIYFDQHSNRNDCPRYSLLGNLCEEEILIAFQCNSNKIYLLDFNNSPFDCYLIQIPPIQEKQIHITSLLILSESFWIIQTEDSSLFSIHIDFSRQENKFKLSLVQRIITFDHEVWQLRKNKHLSPIFFENINLDHKNKNTILTTKNTLLNKMQLIPTELPKSSFEANLLTYLRNEEENMDKIHKTFFLTKSNFILRITSSIVDNKKKDLKMEVIDLARNTIKIVKFQNPQFERKRVMELNEVLSVEETCNGEAAVLQKDGTISIWQFEVEKINKELHFWRQLIGQQNSTSLSLFYEFSDPKQKIHKKSPPKSKGPKKGKMDEKNERHAGGNTWSGGSGGTDTEGLGGRGGAERKYGGHPVTQLSEKEKKEVSEQVLQTQKEMARKALKKKLEEIDMTESDMKWHEKYFESVSQQISQLQLVLQSVEARGNERVWLKQRNEGDLDENRLIEGVIGEKNIFKQRASQDKLLPSSQRKPIRVLFVVDLSASMYHFNHVDGRLDRLLSSVLMVLHSFKPYHHKFQLGLYAHSGDAPLIPFVPFGTYPKDPQEMVKILKKMQAHTEYCSSGDHTLESISLSVDLLTREEADDYYLFVVSDANLQQYNITPQSISKALIKNEKVHAFVIFIASFDEEADKLKKMLPVGKAHICLDQSKLPIVFKQIFTQQMLEQI